MNFLKFMFLFITFSVISQTIADEVTFVDYIYYPPYFNASYLTKLHESNQQLMQIRRYITSQIISSDPNDQYQTYEKLTSNGIPLNIKNIINTYKLLSITNQELVERGFSTQYMIQVFIQPNTGTSKIVNFSDINPEGVLPYQLILFIQ